MPDEGQTHNDVKPTNILIGMDGNVTLIDMDVASCIRSVKSTKPGPVSGSYEWSGTDGLSGFGQAPKDDLDAVGQVLMWASTGKPLWRTPSGKNNKDAQWRQALAGEKKKWRALNWNDRAKYFGLPKESAKVFQKYYDVVEGLNGINERPDYNKLCAIWRSVSGSDAASNLAWKKGARKVSAKKSNEVEETPAEHLPEVLNHSNIKKKKTKNSSNTKAVEEESRTKLDDDEVDSPAPKKKATATRTKTKSVQRKSSRKSGEDSDDGRLEDDDDDEEELEAGSPRGASKRRKSSNAAPLTMSLRPRQLTTATKRSNSKK